MTRSTHDSCDTASSRGSRTPLRHVERVLWIRPAFKMMDAAAAEIGTFSNPDANVNAS